MSDQDVWERIETARQRADDDARARKDFERDFGKQIQRERVRRRWTAEEAAHRAEIAARTWQRVEAGASARPVTLGKIDRLFGLPSGTLHAMWCEGDDPHITFTRTVSSDQPNAADEVLPGQSPAVPIRAVARLIAWYGDQAAAENNTLCSELCAALRVACGLNSRRKT